MKRISHHLWHLSSVLKNPSVLLSPLNSQQKETCDPPKSFASNRVSKALERNHHRIMNIVW